MERYLIDTNVISDYFSSSLPTKGMEFLGSIFDLVPNVSIITQIELLCWNTDELTEQSVNNFINDSVIFDINNEVIAKCAQLRKVKKIKLPDAIIAATAIVNNLILITRNTADFSKIPAIKIIDPHQF